MMFRRDAQRCASGALGAPALVLVALLMTTSAGCVSTVALDRAVLAYDTAATDSVAKQLLLNIARARHNQPIHFTAVSNIAATYKASFNMGGTPAATGDRGFLVVPFLGASIEENPTISIAPMQGEEFTQRLLTPFEEKKLTLLLRQGYDVDALLRLMGSEVILEEGGPGHVRAYHNRPADREGYPVYRRLMAHLSAIQDRQALHVDPLHFQHTWIVPAAAVSPEQFQSTYKDFSITFDEQKKAYRVTKRVNGRVMITNYDPDLLPNDERQHLHDQADEAPFNDVIIDIRPGFVGGEMPLHGRLRLRSFHEILTFLGRSAGEEPEYQVAPDKRTPIIGENPVFAMEIVEARRTPAGARFSVELNGLHYAVRPEKGYAWNEKVFSLLYQLFQMTVSSVPDAGPAITIAK